MERSDEGIKKLPIYRPALYWGLNSFFSIKKKKTQTIENYLILLFKLELPINLETFWSFKFLSNPNLKLNNIKISLIWSNQYRRSKKQSNKHVAKSMRLETKKKWNWQEKKPYNPFIV